MLPVRCTISAVIASFLAAIVVSCSLQAQQTDDGRILQGVLEADDRRDGAAETLQVLMAGARSTDALTRVIAVRALGRVERPDWLPHLNELLASEHPEVRAEAANAVGQAVFGNPSGEAQRLLRNRISVETNPQVLGRLAQTLGRLAYPSAIVAREAETDIMTIGGRGQPLLVARGLESLARLQSRNGFQLSERAARFLGDLLVRTPDTSVDDTESVRVRRMALSALIHGTAVDRRTLEHALNDPDEGVRRLGVIGAASLRDDAERATVIMEAPFDVSPMVRYEIVRLFGRFMQPVEGCVPLIETVNDQSVHVGLLAVDLMANDCASGERVIPLLAQMAGSLPLSGDGATDRWHFPAHALVVLARVAPDVVRGTFERFEGHPQWQVRMYAVRAATHIGDHAALYRLARDTHWNVRTAAIDALKETVGRDADSVYMEALDATDYQLIMTAARALEGGEGTPHVMNALFAALDRVTEDRKDTSRDPRRALVIRIGELGSLVNADRLRPYLSDFDVVVANAAATILSGWLNENVTPSPNPLPRIPVPSVEDLRIWLRTQVTFHMRGGQRIDIALRPFDAPTNVARFVRLAETGYFDGLTFHRVEPNFVIQGGSPGANEYAGDGPYSRDELTSEAHWRGTVGLSTRGRNTGDGQLFVNLIDNVRLDHNYTIFGDVIAGMEVVDATTEGATIDSVSVRLVNSGR